MTPDEERFVEFRKRGNERGDGLNWMESRRLLTIITGLRAEVGELAALVELRKFQRDRSNESCSEAIKERDAALEKERMTAHGNRECLEEIAHLKARVDELGAIFKSMDGTIPGTYVNRLEARTAAMEEALRAIWPFLEEDRKSMILTPDYSTAIRLVDELLHPIRQGEAKTDITASIQNMERRYKMSSSVFQKFVDEKKEYPEGMDETDAATWEGLLEMQKDPTPKEGGA